MPNVIAVSALGQVILWVKERQKGMLISAVICVTFFWKRAVLNVPSQFLLFIREVSLNEKKVLLQRKNTEHQYTIDALA